MEIGWIDVAELLVELPILFTFYLCFCPFIKKKHTGKWISYTKFPLGVTVCNDTL